MDIRGITLDEWKDIVGKVSDEKYGGNLRVHPDTREYGVRKTSVRGRLTVEYSDGFGARRSWTGRRMPAACWHAFRDVLIELFSLHTDAVIVTALARYEGKDGFEDTYPDTANINIGSEMAPAYMPELCDCNKYLVHRA